MDSYNDNMSKDSIDMSSEEKERVVRDIVNYRIEKVRVMENNTVDAERLAALEKTLRSKPPTEVKTKWENTIGEWIEEMTAWESKEWQTDEGVPVWTANGFDSISDWQFHKVKETGTPDYWYTYPKYEKPY